jgi:hypothetical protein
VAPALSQAPASSAAYAAAPKERRVEKSIPYKEMSAGQKTVFLCKLVICIISFGLIFPTLGD